MENNQIETNLKSCKKTYCALSQQCQKSDPGLWIDANLVRVAIQNIG